MKKLLLLSFIVTTFMACSGQTVEDASYKYAYLYKDLPFEMPHVNPPSFPNREVNLLNYGGNPDGITLNTDAFEKAMTDLSDKGGGTLIVPKGIWYTGPIVFRSNINLHLQQGALILFSANFDLYPLVETSFEGLDTRRCQSPISGYELENIAITGEGSINGSGQAWRPLKKGKVSENHWKKVVSSGGVVNKKGDIWYPSESSLKGQELSSMNTPDADMTEAQWQEVKDFLRPVMVSFIKCKNVLFEGVLMENSPAWNVHPLMCENVILDGVFIRNPGYSQNGDGLDLESCLNSIIVNSKFDVGDDGICIKSGKDEDGRRRGIPTENVIVDNCKVFQGHGGFVVGSEMSGGVKNVVVKNCQFLGTDVGLRFKSNRDRGGVVENIYISDIYMFDIATDSFLFDLYYGGKSASESLEDGDVTPVDEVIPPVTEKTPAFKNIYVKDLVSRNARTAMYFNGLPEMNIENINVENAFITSEYGAQLNESKDINFKNVTVISKKGAPYILNNVKNFNGENMYSKENLEGNLIEINGHKTESININGVSSNLVKASSVVNESAVTIK